MSKDSLIFMACTYGAMLLGVLLPAFGEPLRHLLPVMLMIQLLLCFLVTSTPNAPGAAAGTPNLSELMPFMGIKMILTPLICWGVFALILPRYALGAMLLGGVSVGVTAPFFGQLSKADIPFIIAAVVVSCLLLPLTMPALVAAYLYVLNLEAGEGLWRAFFMTGLSLGLYIFLPFALAKGLWKFRPSLAGGVLRHRYYISVSSISCCMFVIFSRYSLPLRENPFMVLEALAGSFCLALIFMGIGIVSGRGCQPGGRVSRLVSMGTANNGIMLILSAQFFSLPEVMITAMYSVPLFLLLIPYQRYAAWKKA